MRILLLLAAVLASPAADTPPTPGTLVVDFENAIVLQPPNDKANRAPQIEEKGVIFKLAREPRTTKAKGLVMYFEHLSTGHKGIGNAMALESIPVQADLPKPAKSVTVTFWGSAGSPALLEAFDAEGKLVDRAQLPQIPTRKSPTDPIPTFTLTVTAPRITHIQFSGPRPGEYLSADTLQIIPAESPR